MQVPTNSSTTPAVYDQMDWMPEEKARCITDDARFWLLQQLPPNQRVPDIRASLLVETTEFMNRINRALGNQKDSND